MPAIKMPNYGVLMPKMALTFMKFHKTLLAFKTPKCGIYIASNGILNAKKEHFEG